MFDSLVAVRVCLWHHVALEQRITYLVYAEVGLVVQHLRLDTLLVPP